MRLVYRIWLSLGIACGVAGLAAAMVAGPNNRSLDTWAAVLYTAGLISLVIAACNKPAP